MVASLAWGGYSNGYIPASALAGIGRGYLLESSAARQFLAANAELKRDHGVDLLDHVNETYRDYAGQVYWRQWWTDRGQPNNAAYPGGSIHGWAKAFDINRDAIGDDAYAAAVAVFLKYGFVRDVSGESWHFSFREASISSWASGNYTPIEDDMYDDAARTELIGTRIDQTILPLLRAILGKVTEDDGELNRILDAIRRENRPRVYQINEPGNPRHSLGAAIDVDEGYWHVYGSAAELKRDVDQSRVAPELLQVSAADFDRNLADAKARLVQLTTPAPATAPAKA